jgi:hypothetical protein
VLRPGSFRVFDLVSVSFEFRFCACVLSWVEILVKSLGGDALRRVEGAKSAARRDHTNHRDRRLL